MARVVKHRKICVTPKASEFRPTVETTQTVHLTLDEVEAMRLSDLEAMDQDRAAAHMEVSRATFQRILTSAHHNVADALVHGKAIEIKGGTYVVADNPCDSETSCQGCPLKK